MPEYHPGLEGYGCADDIYVNGQSTVEENTKYNWQKRGEAERYPTTLKLKFYNNTNEGMWSYFSNFSVYVCDYDKVADICTNVVAATDDTGSKYATTALTGDESVTEETGYLGKAADDVSTHVVATAGAAQTFSVPTAFFKADSSSPANDKKYMVVGAQFVASNDTNYITYLGLFEGQNQYYTPTFCPWNASRYGYAQQWNQIYIVYDRSSETANITDATRGSAVRGKTYIYLNGELVTDGAYRTGVWGDVCDSMTQIKLFAMHNADVSGGDMDMHWDNFEVFFTDTMPNLTYDMPAISATDDYYFNSGYGITLRDATTVADVASNGSIRAYKGGDVTNQLASTDTLSVGDTISVDANGLVRQYTVTADETPTYTLVDNGNIKKDEANAGIFYQISVNKVVNELTLGLEGRTFTITDLGAFDVNTQLTYALLGNIATVPTAITVTSGDTTYIAK